MAHRAYTHHNFTHDHKAVWSIQQLSVTGSTHPDTLVDKSGVTKFGEFLSAPFLHYFLETIRLNWSIARKLFAYFPNETLKLVLLSRKPPHQATNFNKDWVTRRLCWLFHGTWICCKIGTSTTQATSNAQENGIIGLPFSRSVLRWVMSNVSETRSSVPCPNWTACVFLERNK